MAVAVLPLLSWLTMASPISARVRGRVGRGALTRAFALPPPDSTAADSAAGYQPSRRPKPALTDRYGDPFSNPVGNSPMQLTTPDNVKLKVTVDDSLRYFDVTEKVGDTLNYRPPTRMTYKQYSEWQQQAAARNYFRSKSAGLDGESVTTTKRLIPKIYLPPALERIFGGNFVDIRPNGSVTIRAGYRHNRNFNPAIPLRQQSQGDFDFDQTIQLNMTGQVGEKLKLNFNYDTKANFNFENQIKYDYTGSETDIIKKIEAGNVSMPLQSSLIQGGQNLFGAKVQAQFGRMTATVVGATVQGTQDEIRIQNGAQTRKFEIRCDQYDRDRHYYLGQFFRDRYDAALRQLPLINSGIQIRRLEVYITNTSTLAADNLRNVVTLMDLAEPKTVFNQSLLRGGPVAMANGANLLFDRAVTNGIRGQNTADTYLASQGLLKGRDFEHIRARKLDPREYKFNPQLGTLSLSTTLLPDQVCGVAFEYSYNGRVYKVGELSEDYANVGADQVIFLKMLKATNPSLRFPTWDLMMKNVYSLNASQVTRENFQMNIVYKDDETGVNITSLKEGGTQVQDIPLVQVLGLDNVNPNNDRPSDGNFDYFPGITIDPDNGRVYFPVVEPFGSFLRAKMLGGPNPATVAQAEKYVFQQLYDSVQTQATQFTQYTKFFLSGRMQQSASDEVQLPGIRVVPGSVSVYAGGTRLTEGVDYQVFYDLARLKILNPSYLNSANELRINVEKDAIIQVQPRRLVGTRLDYKISNDLTVGGTAMHMIENPLINRVNLGDEPTNNSIWGVDVNLRKDSRFLTKMIDALPLVQTKEPSSITFQGEFAQLVPGKSQLRGENGVSYLDDFENAETPYSLGGTFTGAWKMATPPVGVYNASLPGRASAFGRAKLAWYNVDQTYYVNTGQKPSNIADADLKNHYTRGIQQREIYTNRDPSLNNGYEFPLDLAYFPDERGPYNYTPEVNAEGKLFAFTDPNLIRRNWAGISRGITFDTDFDNANVEYLEFWLMDPFIPGQNGKITDQDGHDSNNTTGGILYLNLGNISEDVVKDAARYEFENGLPSDNSDQNTSPTPFGRGTTLSYLTDAFSTDPGARVNQDVGLDGLQDDGERNFFGDPLKNQESATEYAGVADPSADNFRHHLDESYTSADVKILGRYKNFNGLQGNSPEDSPRASYIFPDKEDLNRDNVVNDVDSYYEYQLPLRPGLDVGGVNGWIVDKVENSSINGDKVTWFLFRVPIRTPLARSINGINGYKNIRFMRLYMTGWREPVVLRMNQMRFVANQWRKFNEIIADGNGGQSGVFSDANAFTVSAVNIENNGSAGAGEIPYVLPPGIQRDRDISSQVNRRVNEQSLQLCIDGLNPGYGKAVWKNTALDMLIYKRLRMFVHAQSSDGTTVPSGALRLFLRVGQDYSRNYYEYSLPLEITPPSSTDENAIWPLNNTIDVALAELVAAKARRNAAGAPINRRFTTSAAGDGRQITIIGNPDFSDVQSLMIGVLNPSESLLPGVTAAPRSVCVWTDELRVFDYDKTAGWATVGRLNAKLADVATVTATGGYSTFGFGALQTKIAQRTRENILQFDVNANVQGDRFLPRKLNLRVPVGVQYGSVVKEPRYDPLDPDTELELSLQKFNEDTKPPDKTVDEARAEYRTKVLDRVTTKSINVLNVRKERGPAPGTEPKPGVAAAVPAKPMPWDIENFALSYAYTERLQTNIITFRDLTKTYTAGIAYAYQANPKSYSPFSTVKLFASPYFQFLKDFNFTPLPSTFSVRADVDRRYREQFLQRRGSVTELPTPVGVEPIFQKSFFFNRIYDLKWNLTKSLSLDYTATNRGVIDEPDGQINGDLFPEKNRVIWQNARRLGRTTAFNQLAALTYRVPLDKFPLTSWVQADARYAAGYTWTAISTALRSDTLRLGNTIQNNREVSVNAKADLVNLYNRVKFLKNINSPPKPAAGALDKNGKPIPGGKDAPGKGLKGGKNPRDRADAVVKGDPKQPKDPKAAPTDAAPTTMVPQVGKDGKPVLGKDGKPVMIAATPVKPAADTTKKKPELKLLKGILRGLMSVRSVNGTYTRTDGTLLPGYLPSTALFGFSQGFTAPTAGFILGQQYELGSLYEMAQANGWYTDSSHRLNTPISNLTTENLNLRANVEPFKNFQIQVEARQTKSRAEEAFYRLEADTNSIDGFALRPYRLATVQPYITGAYSQSFLSVQTLFEGKGTTGRSAAFERFITNRQEIRTAIQQARGLEPGDTSLQGNSQDILLPAFQRAYAGQTASGYKARPFNPLAGLPLPNWSVQYNGLSELPLLKKYFSSVTLSHAYQSTYNIGNYTTSAQYQQAPDGFPDIRSNGRLVPYYVVNTVTIAERMAPLIGVNIKTKKNITGRFEYKIERNLALNTTNAQVTSVFVQDFVVGLGYITNRFKLPWKIRGVRKTLTNDLTMRLDLTIRDNATVQHTIVQERERDAGTGQTLVVRESSQNQTTNGTRQIQLKPTIDYVLNQRLNLQLYFTRIISAPKISSSFRNVVTTAGLQLRYNLGL